MIFPILIITAQQEPVSNCTIVYLVRNLKFLFISSSLNFSNYIKCKILFPIDIALCSIFNYSNISYYLCECTCSQCRGMSVGKINYYDYYCCY